MLNTVICRSLQEIISRYIRITGKRIKILIDGICEEARKRLLMFSYIAGV